MLIARRLCLAVLLAITIPTALPLQAQDKPSDAQGDLQKQVPALRDLDSHCPFTPPASIEAWQARGAQVKQQMQVAMGLWPMPKLEPVQPKIYGKIKLDGYTIEKAIFETLPGFYVTGNLYRPDPMPAGKVPGVLCPHGHWANARFYDETPANIANLLATGGERFETAARNHIQARCVQLARMGCVVYHWDMIGYCDSVQINFDRAHRFGKQPKESEVADDGWLLFSPLAESHAQSILGLQTLAGMRGVDFLLSLPEVDSSRIAITGASGGGTQSFITAALDQRIALAFPAVMVSTGMQGGCTCENASWLRTGTGNVEMASLIAPRPMGLTTANDWTKNMPNDGFPELQKLYDLHGAKDKVALFPAAHFPHNYNHVARTSMYGWVNKHFKLGFKEPVLERDFQWKGQEDLHVWDAEHPQPESGEGFERKLMKRFAEMIESQYADLESKGKQAELTDTLRRGWQVCLGLTTGPVDAVKAKSDGKLTMLSSASDGTWTVRELSGDAINKSVAITVINSKGGQKTYGLALVGQSIDEKGTVADLKEQPLVSNPRLAAAYTYGYNLPLISRRARQLGATLQWLAEANPGATLRVSGQGPEAGLAAAGGFVAQELKVANVQLQLAANGFRFAKAESIRDPQFLPASARYRDLPGLVSCFAGKKDFAP
jgi:hypothetical protein